MWRCNESDSEMIPTDILTSIRKTEPLATSYQEGKDNYIVTCSDGSMVCMNKLQLLSKGRRMAAERQQQQQQPTDTTIQNKIDKVLELVKEIQEMMNK